MWQKIMKFMQMTKIKQVALVICVDNSSIKKRYSVTLKAGTVKNHLIIVSI